MDPQQRAIDAYRRVMKGNNTDGGTARARAADVLAEKEKAFLKSPRRGSPGSTGDKTGSERRESTRPQKGRLPGDGAAESREIRPPGGASRGASASIPGDTAIRGEPAARDSYTKVAKFLSLIGREEASKVMKNLPQEDVVQILHAMTKLDAISPRDARQVLAQFGAEAQGFIKETAVGPETAREILIRAFGDKAGERLFYRAVPDYRPSRFDFLSQLDGRQLASLLGAESPTVIAAVAANLPASTAARLLHSLQGKRRTETVQRIARMKNVDPMVVESIEAALHKKLDQIGVTGETDVPIDGSERLASILRYMDLSTETRVLGELQRHDPDLGESVRQRLTTIEDILRIPRRDMQELLREVDDRELAILVKGKTEDMVAWLLSNISERRREIVEALRETLGPMQRREVNRVTSEFLQSLRRKAEAGEIEIRPPDDDEADYVE